MNVQIVKSKIALFLLFDKIIKKKNIISFSSYTDYSDNPYALFSYIITDERLFNYSFIWLMSDKSYLKRLKQKTNDKRIKFAYKKSLYGLYLYFSSKIVFYSHGLYGNVKSYNNKKRVNLWHGMPFKKVGLLDENFDGVLPSQDRFIVSSDFCSSIYSKSFNIGKENIKIFGQPRIDLLFKKGYFLKKKNIDKKEYKLIVGWLPTYRKSFVGDVRIDGNFDAKKIGFLDIKDLFVLDRELIVRKTILVIKIHPMDILNKTKIKGLKNIIIVSNGDLSDEDEQLYTLLGEMDALITDYSSIFIDYMILNKPIAFTMNDFESYNKTRGFLFNNPKEKLAGKFIYNYKDMLDFIKDLENNKDVFKEKREKINKQYNNFIDGDNSKRITDWMLNEML